MKSCFPVPSQRRRKSSESGNSLSGFLALHEGHGKRADLRKKLSPVPVTAELIGPKKFASKGHLSMWKATALG